MLWRRKNTKTELQVSSLNQRFLSEMGTIQQSSLSKQSHNCLSETLASSLLTVLLFCGILASLSHWCVCSCSASFTGIYFYVHLVAATKILGFIWRARSRSIGFLWWDFWIAVWKVFPPSAPTFLSTSIMASLFIMGEETEATVPESSQVSVQHRTG